MPLDLSLPEPPPRKGSTVLPIATFTLALAAVVLLLLLLGRAPENAGDSGTAPAVGDRELAELLEKRTLWREAAGLWEQLAESGEDLFRAGKCRMLAGEPERAARNLLAAEARGLSEELTRESSRLVLEAYAMLGKFEVRNQALERRTGADSAEQSDIIARVGEEPVTRDALLALVRDEEIAKLLGTGRPDRDALDRAISARSASPESLVPTLSRLLSTRALALAALSDGLGDSPVLALRLRELRRELLANLLVENRLLGGIRISEDDLEDHWKSHPERYTAPLAAKLSFGATPESLTEAEGWHEQGAEYPESLPPSAEADAVLFALEPGETSSRSVRFADREVYLRLDEKRPAWVIPFAEAREAVAADLFARKRAEAMAALEREVMAAHQLEVVDPELKKLFEAAGTRER